MSSNQTSKEEQTQPKQKVPSGFSQQGNQISPELKQQICLLNIRANNANLSYNDLLKETANTIRMMASTIIMLQQENATLKARAQEKKANT